MFVWAKLTLVGVILLLNDVMCGEMTQLGRQRQEATYALFHPTDAAWGAKLLHAAAEQGDFDSQSDLTLAQLLGTGIRQDIAVANSSSRTLAELGGTTARITQAFLLSHGLTGADLTPDERQQKALTHYLLAAMNKDPLAQIMVGVHYLSTGDCESALQYLRLAAETVIPNVSEDTRAASTPQFVWPEDSLFPDEYQPPSLDELQFLEYSAAQGDAEAALKAALVLYHGVPGVEANLAAAAEYLEQAAEAQLTPAMILLVSLHLHHQLPGGHDPHHLKQILESALSLGDETAHTYLGFLYLTGHGGLPRNLNKAKKHLEAGVQAGHVDAFYLLGKIKATETAQNSQEQAAQLWKVAALLGGHLHAAYQLAEHYWSRMHLVTDITLSPTDFSSLTENLCQDAVPLYRLVALSGRWRQLYEAAHFQYQQGQLSQALLQYLILSDMGYPSAHVNAGRLLDTVAGSVYSKQEEADTEALKVWGRAAEAGLAVGHLRLGDLHYYGQSTYHSLADALTHYTQAAHQGNAQAAFNLAWMQEWGEGHRHPNITTARAMYQSLCQTHPDACVPVTLATLRLDFFHALQIYTGLDLYAVNWSGFFHSYHSKLPAWDIVLMVGLAALIVLLILAWPRR